VEIFQTVLELPTSGRGLWPLTSEITEALRESGLSRGLCTLFIQHTSASLVIQENADPSVLRDLTAWLDDVAPETRRWTHDDEGPDDMPAHVKSAITKTSESIPFQNGRLLLGTWQGVYVAEHRARPHLRRVVAHFVGVRDA
jgi:secondary thiamine-phosphate synthase enzyme